MARYCINPKDKKLRQVQDPPQWWVLTWRAIVVFGLLGLAAVFADLLAAIGSGVLFFGALILIAWICWRT